MDSTSNRTPINLESNGDEIDLTGWRLLESVVYDLWLSPCETYLVQHYKPRAQEDQRLMRSAYVHDTNLQDFRFRQLNRMGQIIGMKNWEFMVVHEFTGCHWYGFEDFPEDLPQLLDDMDKGQISWPTLRPGNLYRNPEGELRVIGPCTAFEDQGQPYNLQFWGQLMTKDELRIAKEFQENGYVDTRIWANHVFGRGTPVNSGEAAVAHTPKN